MMKRWLCLAGLIAVLSGCTSESDEVVIDLRGAWRAQVTINSCSPAAACEDAGFVQGSILPAVLILTQDLSELDGTYSYEGLPVSVPVSGRVGSSVVVLNGVFSNTLGSVTVNFSGAASGDTITATITHQITRTGGSAANVSGSGTFTR